MVPCAGPDAAQQPLECSPVGKAGAAVPGTVTVRGAESPRELGQAQTQLCSMCPSQQLQKNLTEAAGTPLKLQRKH